MTEINRPSPALWPGLTRRLFYAAWLLATSLGLLEAVYRCYLFDFYRPELLGLNRPEDLAARPDTCRTLLVFGDSFSASPDGWVSVLRDSFPRWRIINAAVPGTCSREAARMAAARVREFQPEVVVFQLFTGNDLLDLRHPIAWGRLPFARNLYWWLADRIHVLGFINYRLARFGIAPNRPGAAAKAPLPFSPERYNAREKINFRGEPALVENTVLLRGGRERDFETMADWLKTAISPLGDSCRALLLPLPSCLQVNGFYRQNLLSVGAATDFGEAVFSENPPFVQRLREKFERAGGRVSVLDPLGHFQKTDVPARRLYFENDPHFSPAGARAMGEWATGELARHLAK